MDVHMKHQHNSDNVGDLNSPTAQPLRTAAWIYAQGGRTFPEDTVRFRTWINEVRILGCPSIIRNIPTKRPPPREINQEELRLASVSWSSNRKTQDEGIINC